VAISRAPDLSVGFKGSIGGGETASCQDFQFGGKGGFGLLDFRPEKVGEHTSLSHRTIKKAKDCWAECQPDCSQARRACELL
jgi:hypothetical protein